MPEPPMSIQVIKNTADGVPHVQFMVDKQVAHVASPEIHAPEMDLVKTVTELKAHMERLEAKIDRVSAELVEVKQETVQKELNDMAAVYNTKLSNVAKYVNNRVDLVDLDVENVKSTMQALREESLRHSETLIEGVHARLAGMEQTDNVGQIAETKAILNAAVDILENRIKDTDASVSMVQKDVARLIYDKEEQEKDFCAWRAVTKQNSDGILAALEAHSPTSDLCTAMATEIEALKGVLQRTTESALTATNWIDKHTEKKWATLADLQKMEDTVNDTINNVVETIDRDETKLRERIETQLAECATQLKATADNIVAPIRENVENTLADVRDIVEKVLALQDAQEQCRKDVGGRTQLAHDLINELMKDVNDNKTELRRLNDKVNDVVSESNDEFENINSRLLDQTEKLKQVETCFDVKLDMERAVKTFAEKQKVLDDMLSPVRKQLQMLTDNEAIMDTLLKTVLKKLDEQVGKLENTETKLDQHVEKVNNRLETKEQELNEFLETQKAVESLTQNNIEAIITTVATNDVKREEFELKVKDQLTEIVEKHQTLENRMMDNNNYLVCMMVEKREQCDAAVKIALSKIENLTTSDNQRKSALEELTVDIGEIKDNMQLVDKNIDALSAHLESELKKAVLIVEDC